MVEPGFTSISDDFLYCLENNLGPQKGNKLCKSPSGKHIEHSLSSYFGRRRGFGNTDQPPSLTEALGPCTCVLVRTES